MHDPSRTDPARRGAVLILTLAIGILLAVLLAAGVIKATNMARNARFSLDRLEALALAEGVTERAQKEMLATVANFKPLQLSGTVQIGSTSYPYAVTQIGSSRQQVESDGRTVVLQPYEISAAVDVDSARAEVHRVVNLTKLPIYQFMIFYAGDLEVLPGPDMWLGGRVHANGDIYVGSGSTLTVDTDYFRATGEILRRRKNDGSETGGTVEVKVFGETDYQPLDPSTDSEHPSWLAISNSTWKGTVQSAAHGVKEVAAPSIQTIQPYDPDGTKSYYHRQAALVLKGDKAYDAAGNEIPGMKGIVYKEKLSYDAREGKALSVTEIDLAALAASGYYPANGLLYAYRLDSNPAHPSGIRLVNGSELAAPLTLVSPGPVYIQGDFNTVGKKSAAVICDALNLLSNAWNDTKIAGTLPKATETTFNLAVVTGDVPTPDGGGNYSGGFENLPRFHENWTGVTARIRGAFIKIFESQIARAPWRYGGDVYTAPVRDWQFDPDFLDLDKLPPFTPNAVYFKRVIWDDGVPSALEGGSG